MLFFLTVKTESRDLSMLGGLYHQAVSIKAKLVLFIIPGIWQVFNT